MTDKSINLRKAKVKARLSNEELQRENLRLRKELEEIRSLAHRQGHEAFGANLTLNTVYDILKRWKRGA